MYSRYEGVSGDKMNNVRQDWEGQGIQELAPSMGNVAIYRDGEILGFLYLKQSMMSL